MYLVHWAYAAGNILALNTFPSDKKWRVPLGTTCSEFAAVDPSSAKGRERGLLRVAHADLLQDQSLWVISTKAPIPLGLIYNLYGCLCFGGKGFSMGATT